MYHIVENSSAQTLWNPNLDTIESVKEWIMKLISSLLLENLLELHFLNEIKNGLTVAFNKISRVVNFHAERHQQ